MKKLIILFTLIFINSDYFVLSQDETELYFTSHKDSDTIHFGDVIKWNRIPDAKFYDFTIIDTNWTCVQDGLPVLIYIPLHPHENNFITLQNFVNTADSNSNDLKCYPYGFDVPSRKIYVIATAYLKKTTRNY